MAELLGLLGAIVLVSLIYFVIFALVVMGIMLILDIKNKKIYVATYLFSLALTLLGVLSNLSKVCEALGW